MSIAANKLNEFLDWNWDTQPAPQPLSSADTAPPAFGLYELGEMVGGEFIPKYVGRAAGVSLRQRLKAHYRHSHNERVRAHAHQLYFRYRIINTAALAAYIEAVSIVALEYPFNRRNEWRQHWALES